MARYGWHEWNKVRFRRNKPFSAPFWCIWGQKYFFFTLVNLSCQRHLEPGAIKLVPCATNGGKSDADGTTLFNKICTLLLCPFKLWSLLTPICKIFGLVTHNGSPEVEQSLIVVEQLFLRPITFFWCVLRACEAGPLVIVNDNRIYGRRELEQVGTTPEQCRTTDFQSICACPPCFWEHESASFT